MFRGRFLFMVVKILASAFDISPYISTMKILLTGANGYIGVRLLHQLLKDGHNIVCAVRDKNRLSVSADILRQVDIIEVDFIDPPETSPIPSDIDAAYYLIHSMSSTNKDFDELEAKAAKNFNALVSQTDIKQVIYLSGIVNEEKLSKHLLSRKRVEEILQEGKAAVTTLRAGIIVGSGSSSFEIIRDLCEKLPFMVTPKWVNTKTHPIAIRDVLKFLIGVLGREDVYDQSYDIGGPDVLTYKEMMRQYAQVRRLNLNILTVPVMTPRLSSYWMYFVTSTSHRLAQNLVDSMSVEVVASDKRLQQKLGIETISYKKAISLAFDKIEQNQVISSWKDSLSSGRLNTSQRSFVQVPKRGVLRDAQKMETSDPHESLNRIWALGGKNGYYYADFLWKIRGYLDKLVGGVGLRRGRTNPDQINTGDSLDFWRVILADREERRLLLYAEMKVPGEAWLEFKIDRDNTVHQTATFRPTGLRGRLYWYSMLPFHYFIFRGMLQHIAQPDQS